MDRVISTADYRYGLTDRDRIDDLGQVGMHSLLGFEWWHLLAGIRVEPPAIVGGRR